MRSCFNHPVWTYLAALLLIGAVACGAGGKVGENYHSADSGVGGSGATPIDGGSGGAVFDGGCISLCVGNEVHACNSDGTPGELVATCDTAIGEVCKDGTCVNACEAAGDEPSNMGCEFWAVDLDLSDGITDPASAPWGLAISNAGQAPADVTIELNEAGFGEPLNPVTINQSTVQPGELLEVVMPTREIDCGSKPNDRAAPGTCLTSNAFRIRSTAPIVVYQFNNWVHHWSSDASLLLPTTSVGKKYRVIGWPSAHSYPLPGAFVQRGYVTIVGVAEATHIKVIPSWRIKGNGPIPATPAGGVIELDIGPFDVVNLETDDSTLAECLQMQTPPYCADLTGTIIEANAPVAVFSGTESSGVAPPDDAPKPPLWDEEMGGCCLQHLEEQLHPLDSIGRKFVVTRSPVRSNPELSSYEEPDVLRFMGVAATAQVTTNLPPPMDSFTLQPGQVIDTWTQKDIVVSATEPIFVAQFLVVQGYVNSGQPDGDPSFTVFPPVEQARTEYVFLSPKGWKRAFVVIAAETGTNVTIDGAVASGCTVSFAGTLDGKLYEARRCPLSEGVHRLSGNAPFGIMAYGFGDADAYSFAGGAFFKKIYEPPPLY